LIVDESVLKFLEPKLTQAHTVARCAFCCAPVRGRQPRSGGFVWAEGANDAQLFRDFQDFFAALLWAHFSASGVYYVAQGGPYRMAAWKCTRARGWSGSSEFLAPGDSPSLLAGRGLDYHEQSSNGRAWLRARLRMFFWWCCLEISAQPD